MDCTLQDLGYQVLTATNGKEALDVKQNYSGRIDMLLSDVVMPAMGGVELAEFFHEHHPDTKVVLMSGYPGRDRARNADILGNTRLLQKPVPRRRLALAIRQELDGADAEIMA